MMAGIRFDASQLQAFVARLLPAPSPPTRAQADPAVERQNETRLQKICHTRRDIATVFSLGIRNGFEMRPEETLWGALNAVTAFVDHRQRFEGDRYAHILFGSGAALKRAAYNLALTYLPDRKGQEASLN